MARKVKYSYTRERDISLWIHLILFIILKYMLLFTEVKMDQNNNDIFLSLVSSGTIFENKKKCHKNIYVFYCFRIKRNMLIFIMNNRKGIFGSNAAFLPFTQNIFRQPIPENLWLHPTFFADAPMKFFFNLALLPLQHFWDTQYKIFFSLIKKIFLQTLVELTFRYHKFFLEFSDPPTNKMKISHMRCWVSK